MQITLLPLPSGTPIPLTGTRPTEGIAGGVIQHGRLIEQLAKIRAEESEFRPRKNIAHNLSFSITREHADEGVAALYYLMHAQSLPDLCKVEFRIERFNGSIAAIVFLNKAIVTGAQGDWDGVSTTFNYTIQGGKFTT
jgi:hypothetical protein